VLAVSSFLVYIVPLDPALKNGACGARSDHSESKRYLWIEPELCSPCERMFKMINCQEGPTMKPADEKRKSGIEFVEDLPWGTHFWQFYQTKEDLLGILIPYFRAGLENNELCVWIIPDFLTKKGALKAMGKGVPGFSEYTEKRQIEIFPYADWYLKDATFDLKRSLHMLMDKHDEALSKGFAGMRISGNARWRNKSKDWNDLGCYEAAINNVVGDAKLLVLCTYSLDKCGVVEILDVVKNHYRPSPMHDLPLKFV
jgi:hypothetical protein